MSESTPQDYLDDYLCDDPVYLTACRQAKLDKLYRWLEARRVAESQENKVQAKTEGGADK